TLTFAFPQSANGLANVIAVADSSDAVADADAGNNALAAPLAVIPPAAAAQARTLLAQLETAFGAQTLAITNVASAANGALSLTIGKSPSGVPQFAGFPVGAFNLTVGLDGGTVTAIGTAQLGVKVAGVDAPFIVSVALNGGVLQIDGATTLDELKLGGDPAI